jgi:putative photosynthetic complex assembly protein
MSHAADHHDPTVPTAAIKAAGLMLLAILLLTAAVSFGLIDKSADPVASRMAAHVGVQEARSLRFADGANGAVIVTDTNTDTIIYTAAAGEGGFLRATVRRLAKARAAKGIGSQPPFILTRWDNGALSLRDPETGKNAEIIGFGKSQTDMFAAMLKGPAA